MQEIISKRVWGIILLSWGKYQSYKNVSVPTEKEVTNIDKEGNENVVTIPYKL